MGNTAIVLHTAGNVCDGHSVQRKRERCGHDILLERPSGYCNAGRQQQPVFSRLKPYPRGAVVFNPCAEQLRC